MALSNILREPRREITETALGIIVIGIIVYPDYKFACWLHKACGNMAYANREVLPVPIGMIIGPVLLVLILMVLIGTLMVLIGIHNIGEGVADSLARHGVQVRPRKRYFS